jgi:hypothetical protein
VEGYEGVEALGGFRPPTAVVLQGRTPGTRLGCAGGWRVEDFYYITFHCSSISRGCH